MNGTLYGVGVGPGDPELLTLKAHRLISQATLLVYPAPDEGDSFARAIVAEYIREGTEELVLRVPMRTDRFPVKSIYDDFAGIIAARLQAGEDVVVLCEGDPFFYGSFMYLFTRLRPQFDCQVVPGVSSIMAGAALAERPLGSLSEAFTVAPGPLPEARLAALLASSENLLFLKVGRHLAKIRRVIEAAGLLDQAIYLERVTLDSQRCLPLAELGDDAAPYFSMILLNRREEAPR